MSVGKSDFSELEAFVKKIEKFSREMDEFCKDCAKELAARLLSYVIPETPTGDYPKSTGKVGGTLKRGWSTQENEENHLKITKKGDIYEIEVINPVPYSPYVEYGHRTRNGGWVEGRFFLTHSEILLEAQVPAILERKLTAKLKEVLE